MKKAGQVGLVMSTFIVDYDDRTEIEKVRRVVPDIPELSVRWGLMSLRYYISTVKLFKYFEYNIERFERIGEHLDFTLFLYFQDKGKLDALKGLKQIQDTYVRATMENRQEMNVGLNPIAAQLVSHWNVTASEEIVAVILEIFHTYMDGVEAWYQNGTPIPHTPPIPENVLLDAEESFQRLEKKTPPFTQTASLEDESDQQHEGYVNHWKIILLTLLTWFTAGSLGTLHFLYHSTEWNSVHSTAISWTFFLSILVIVTAVKVRRWHYLLLLLPILLFGSLMIELLGTVGIIAAITLTYRLFYLIEKHEMIRASKPYSTQRSKHQLFFPIIVGLLMLCLILIRYEISSAEYAKQDDFIPVDCRKGYVDLIDLKGEDWLRLSHVEKKQLSEKAVDTYTCTGNLPALDASDAQELLEEALTTDDNKNQLRRMDLWKLFVIVLEPEENDRSTTYTEPDLDKDDQAKEKDSPLDEPVTAGQANKDPRYHWNRHDVLRHEDGHYWNSIGFSDKFQLAETYLISVKAGGLDVESECMDAVDMYYEYPSNLNDRIGNAMNVQCSYISDEGYGYYYDTETGESVQVVPDPDYE